MMLHEIRRRISCLVLRRSAIIAYSYVYQVNLQCAGAYIPKNCFFYMLVNSDWASIISQVLQLHMYHTAE